MHICVIASHELPVPPVAVDCFSAQSEAWRQIDVDGEYLVLPPHRIGADYDRYIIVGLGLSELQYSPAFRVMVALREISLAPLVMVGASSMQSELYELAERHWFQYFPRLDWRDILSDRVFLGANGPKSL